MEVLRSYVIRIYRQESDAIAGVIESVETGDATAFRSLDELCATISRPLAARRSFLSKFNNKEDGK